MVRRAALVLLALAACVGDDPVSNSFSPEAGATPDSGTGTPAGDSGSGIDTGTPVTDSGTDAAPCLQRAPGMISWWTGDDTLQDHVEQTNNMTSVTDGGGVVGFAAGHVGKALAFDRTAQLQRNVPAGISGLNAFTVEGWVNRLGVTDERIIDRTTAGQNDGWLFDIWQKKLRFQFYGKDVSSTIEVPSGTTLHVAVTFDGKTARLFIDGAENNADSVTTAVPLPDPTNVPLRIGGDSKGTSRFEGFIDELAMYSRALTPAEIAAVHAAGPNGRCK